MVPLADRHQCVFALIRDPGSIGEVIRLYPAGKIPNGWSIVQAEKKRKGSAQGINGPLTGRHQGVWFLIRDGGKRCR